VKLVTYKTVEVLFVIVPFVALIADKETFDAERFVTVAFDNVALVPIKLYTFDVEALDVVA
jgi:hypothetical protein